MLKFEFSDADQHARAESLRNKLVGEALPYQGKFRKMRVEHQNLLSCLFTMQASDCLYKNTRSLYYKMVTVFNNEANCLKILLSLILFVRILKNTGILRANRVKKICQGGT